MGDKLAKIFPSRKVKPGGPFKKGRFFNTNCHTNAGGLAEHFSQGPWMLTYAEKGFRATNHVLEAIANHK